ncbi:transposase [Bernardetia sp. ABR2-2B]|uniref:transposase n=1 Tax=Bernardetia sp. ABR2-2B TaxID=3127472 RepID=UPI0030D4FE43
MAKYKGKYRSESHRLKGWDYSSEAIYFITFCVQDFECLFGDVIVDSHHRANLENNANPKNNEIQNNEIRDNETHDGASVRIYDESARMNLNPFGKIVEEEILKSIEIRNNWIFHEWVVMPNHVHMLIEIEFNDNNTVQTHRGKSQNKNNTIHNNTIHDDTIHDNTIHDGAIHDGAIHDGAIHDGAIHDGESLLHRQPNSISSFIGIFKTVVTKQINELRNTKGERIWQRNYHDHIVRNYRSFQKIANYVDQNPQRWYEDRFNPTKKDNNKGN